MDWYQKFGLPQPEEGANEQGAAAPDADETPEGENGQEVAAPAETEEAEDHAAETQPDAEDAPQEEAQQPQDKETRRQQAAARREREQREADRCRTGIRAGQVGERGLWQGRDQGSVYGQNRGKHGGLESIPGRHGQRQAGK